MWQQAFTAVRDLTEVTDYPQVQHSQTIFWGASGAVTRSDHFV